MSLKKLFILLSVLVFIFSSQLIRAEGDPLEGINRPISNFNDALDRKIMQPIAKGYVKITPKPVRNGVTNFFNNLGYLNVIMNDVLQGKFSQGFDDTMRFVINSTVGIGGLLDVAGHGTLPQNNEDLGQTFGVWGAGEGAYLTLPLFGPNSVRDAPDIVSSALLNPLTYFAFAIAAPITAVDLVNTRANLLEATKFRDEAALDSYSFTREAYRQYRTSLIHDGNPPIEEFDDFFDEDEIENEESSSGENSSSDGVLIIE